MLVKTKELVDALKPGEVCIFFYRHILDMDIGEISQRRNISKKAVSSIARRVNRVLGIKKGHNELIQKIQECYKQYELPKNGSFFDCEK